MLSNMKGIHCNLFLRPSQGTSCCDNRMEQGVTGTFSLVQFRLHAERVKSGFRWKEEGRYGKHTPFAVTSFKPVYVPVYVVSAPPNVATKVERETRSGEKRLCGVNELLVEETSNLKIVAAWDSLQAKTRLHVDSRQPLSSRFRAAVKRIHMAPRLRTTPRRGRHHGQRGGVGGRGTHSPRRVSPLACASPSSNRSDDSGQSISNTVQSARFQYRRRTNKPFISVLVMVIFSEEDEEEVSMKDPFEEQSPSPSNNSSPSRWMEDSSYAPSLQSKIEEESTFAHTEEQVEVLEEIVSM